MKRIANGPNSAPITSRKAGSLPCRSATKWQLETDAARINAMRIADAISHFAFKFYLDFGDEPRSAATGREAKRANSQSSIRFGRACWALISTRGAFISALLRSGPCPCIGGPFPSAPYRSAGSLPWMPNRDRCARIASSSKPPKRTHEWSMFRPSFPDVAPPNHSILPSTTTMLINEFPALEGASPNSGDDFRSAIQPKASRENYLFCGITGNLQKCRAHPLSIRDLVPFTTDPR